MFQGQELLESYWRACLDIGENAYRRTPSGQLTKILDAIKHLKNYMSVCELEREFQIRRLELVWVKSRGGGQEKLFVDPLEGFNPNHASMHHTWMPESLE